MHLHKTQEMIIKKGKVDKGIEPVVRWLNSFAGIYTRWSCEGEYDKNGEALNTKQPILSFIAKIQ